MKGGEIVERDGMGNTQGLKAEGRHSQPETDGMMMRTAAAFTSEPTAREMIEHQMRRLRTDAEDLQELLDHLPAKLSPGAQRALMKLAYS